MKSKKSADRPKKPSKGQLMTLQFIEELKDQSTKQLATERGIVVLRAAANEELLDELLSQVAKVRSEMGMLAIRHEVLTSIIENRR